MSVLNIGCTFLFDNPPNLSTSLTDFYSKLVLTALADLSGLLFRPFFRMTTLELR